MTPTLFTRRSNVAGWLAYLHPTGRNVTWVKNPASGDWILIDSLTSVQVDADDRLLNELPEVRLFGTLTHTGRLIVTGYCDGELGLLNEHLTSEIAFAASEFVQFTTLVQLPNCRQAAFDMMNRLGEGWQARHPLAVWRPDRTVTLVVNTKFLGTRVRATVISRNPGPYTDSGIDSLQCRAIVGDYVVDSTYLGDTVEVGDELTLYILRETGEVVGYE